MNNIGHQRLSVFQDRIPALLATLLLQIAGGVAPAADLTAPEDSAGELGEIIVTAQKRSERLQDVPISISALGSDALDKARLGSPAALVGFVPNLQMQNTVGDETPIFALRGVSMSDFSLNQASPVATYYDEVYKGNFALFGVSMFDLERVEVLRGPQGTLYGKNTTGGAINFIARKPTFDTSGYVRAGFGNYDRKELSAAFQAPLGKSVAVRIAATYTDMDGWFKNLLPGYADLNAKHEYGVRATFLFKPTDEVEIVLRAATSLQDMPNYGIYAIPYPALGCIGGGVYASFHALYPASNPNTDDCRTGLSPRQLQSRHTPDRENRTHSVSLNASWNINDHMTLTSVSSWDKGTLFIPEDSSGSFLKALYSDYGDEVTQFAQDLRLSGDIGALKYIVGAYYNREKVFNTTTIGFFTDIDVNGDGALNNLDCALGLTLGLEGCNIRNAFDQLKRSTALYTDLAWRASDRVTLRGGVRYTKDKGEQYNLTSNAWGTDEVLVANLIPGPVPVTALGTGCVPDGTTTVRCAFDASKVTAKIGIDFKPAEDVLLYASASRGYRAGAFNAQAFYQPADTSVARPESVDAYEVGFKTMFADRRITLNGAAFHYRYKDQQILNTDPTTFAQTLVNLPRSRIQGAELELNARLTSRLTAGIGAGLLNTRVQEGTVSGVDVAGTRLASAPATSLNASIDWTAVSSADFSVVLGVNGTYASLQYFDPFNGQSQPGYALLNARLAVRSADERWSVALWGTNLADKFYFTNKIDLPSFGFDYTHIGAPRMYGATLEYRF